VKEVMDWKNVPVVTKKKEIPDDVGWVDDKGREDALKDKIEKHLDENKELAAKMREDAFDLGIVPALNEDSHVLTITKEDFPALYESANKHLGAAFKYADKLNYPEVTDNIAKEIMPELYKTPEALAKIAKESKSVKINIMPKKKAEKAVTEDVVTTYIVPKSKKKASGKKLKEGKHFGILKPKKSVKSPKKQQKSNAGRKKGVANKNNLSKKDVEYIIANKDKMSKMAIARHLKCTRFNVGYVLSQKAKGKILRHEK
jgi:hypothetical protein